MFDVALIALVAAMDSTSLGPGTIDHTAADRDVVAMRQRRDERLRADDGWLSLVGLFWLHEGDNQVGHASGSTVLLPAPAAPAFVGVMHRHGLDVSFKAAPQASVKLGGQPVTEQALQSDIPGPPDVLELGSLRFFVIKRGERVGVRLRDLESPRRKNFPGLKWYPIKHDYRVVARLVPNDKPTTITVPTLIGTTESFPSPGTLVFSLGQQEFRLAPVLESPGDKELFIILRDQTSGKTTYGAGRFLYVPLPDAQGKVIIDFNKAYAPPCSVTPFATCPMPPKQNWLAVPIEAGEMSDH